MKTQVLYTGKNDSGIAVFTPRHSSGNPCAFDCISKAIVEDVVVVLKGTTNEEATAYSDWGYKSLKAALIQIGMVESLPAPDENK